ncbi:hypothetical protein PSEUDO9AZ_20560 [Pseudomonas sp. 9AZ]|nr:hypothetical protein PSEUDO9AZ_20560 [Pseudomonas sp. 9AZ]
MQLIVVLRRRLKRSRNRRDPLLGRCEAICYVRNGLTAKRSFKPVKAVKAFVPHGFYWSSGSSLPKQIRCSEIKNCRGRI